MKPFSSLLTNNHSYTVEITITKRSHRVSTLNPCSINESIEDLAKLTSNQNFTMVNLLVDVYFGSDRQAARLLLDTGSTFTAVNQFDCSSC